MRPRLSRRREDGVSLIEVVVAVAVLSIALVGLFQVLNQSLRTATSGGDRLLAELVARNRAEELQAGLFDGGGRVALAGREWIVETRSRQVSATIAEVAIAARPEGRGAGSEVFAWLPADAPLRP